MFKTGFELYLKGEWQRSKEILANIDTVKGQSDYPSKNILSVMEETNYIAPKDWAGFRVLTEK